MGHSYTTKLGYVFSKQPLSEALWDRLLKLPDAQLAKAVRASAKKQPKLRTPPILAGWEQSQQAKGTQAQPGQGINQRIQQTIEGVIKNALKSGQRRVSLGIGRMQPGIAKIAFKTWQDTLRKYQLFATWERLGESKDERLVGDFGDSMDIRNLVATEAPIALKAGPDHTGRYVLNVGTIAQGIVARGQTNHKQLMQMFANLVKQYGIDPTKITFGAAQPGTPRTARRSAKLDMSR